MVMGTAMSKVWKVVAWVLSVFIAYIFVYYLQFKFTGHPGSTELFTTLTDWLGLHGHEKAMRIGTGTTELIASILLFVPRTQVIGAAMAFVIMSGAIFFHLASPLGVDPYGDGGVLFKEACAVWASGIIIVTIRRREAIELAERYAPFLPIPRWLRA